MQAIERALGSCAVVLVMIGPNWVSARSRRGESDWIGSMTRCGSKYGSR